MAEPTNPQVTFSEPQVTTLNLQLAGLGMRVLAVIVDSVCINIVAAILGLNRVAYYGGSMSYNGFFLLGLVYVIGFWIWKSATPGKMLFGIKIVDAEGKNLTPAKAIVRYIGYIISMVLFGLGFIWAFFDSKKQGWHDKIAQTYVVKA